MWNSIKEIPETSDAILIKSNYGVRTGFYSEWSGLFQDQVTGNDAGMEDMEGVVFEPTEWAYMEDFLSLEEKNRKLEGSLKYIQKIASPNRNIPVMSNVYRIAKLTLEEIEDAGDSQCV